MAQTEYIYGTLPSQWKMATINELIVENKASLQTGPFGTMLYASAYQPTGIPVVAVQHIGENRLLHTDMPRVDDETYQRLIRYQLQPGDIIFGRKGSVERRALIRTEEKGWLQGSDCIRLRLNSSEIDPTFVSYVLGTRAFREWIIQHAHGATMPSLNQEILGRIPLPIPPLQEQYAIANVLGALDDKIELNRRMNQTLESMARAMFVEMMKDENGRMKVEKLGDICEFAYGKGLKEDERQAGSIPVYGSNGQIGWHNEYLVKGPGIVVGRKGNPGIVTWAQNDFIPIDTTFYVVPKEAKTSLYWLYYTLISLNLPDLGADSAVPGLNRNIAYMSDVDYPPHDLMNKFDAFVMPLFGKIDANEKQSRTLASLRDTLLPKLMRGEVRVSLTDSKTD